MFSKSTLILWSNEWICNYSLLCGGGFVVIFTDDTIGLRSVHCICKSRLRMSGSFCSLFRNNLLRNRNFHYTFNWFWYGILPRCSTNCFSNIGCGIMGTCDIALGCIFLLQPVLLWSFLDLVRGISLFVPDWYRFNYFFCLSLLFACFSGFKLGSRPSSMQCAAGKFV